MGNCLKTRSKVDNSLSSQATTATTKLPNRDHLSSSSSSLIKTDCGEGVPSSRSAARTESDILSSPHLKAFSFIELKNATRNFRSDNLIGDGGFGYVYKGWLDEHTLVAARSGCGMVVAVKKLKPEGFQGHKEWLSEVNYLGQLHHPNLVKLIGYCLEKENRLLVYEYLSKGSLENHLFRRGARPLSWAIRIRVAIDAARGLSFLHDSEEPVIYRDFKASNILLDSEFNAKLSDFGLAKAGPTGDHSHVSTQVLGTQGYAAPEYIATGRLTASCDVYSFGVVLLELLSGRPAVDKTKTGVEENLVDWAKPYLGDRRKLFRIMDTKLEGQYPQRAAYTVGLLALQCISEAKVRPRMAEVLSALEQLPTFPCLTSPRDVCCSSHSEAQAVASPMPKSPLRKSYPTSPANVPHKGSSLPSKMNSSSPVKSPRERRSFEMKSPLNVKSSQEMKQPKMKSPRHAKSSKEMQQSETKSPRNAKSLKEMRESEMISPLNVESPKEQPSSETRSPHHMQSPLSGMIFPHHIKSPHR